MFARRIKKTNKMASNCSTLWRIRMPQYGGDKAVLWYPISELSAKFLVWVEFLLKSLPYGVSGIQTSSRHRIITEQCGGTCSTTFRKTRGCPEQSCLNGGSLHSNGTCFCNEGFSGDCCQKKLQEGKLKTEEYLIHTLYSSPDYH